MNIVAESIGSATTQETDRAALADAVAEWSEGYDKSDAHMPRNKANAKFEKNIIRLSASIPPPTYTGMLYRGTGINDAKCAEIIAGKTVKIKTSPGRHITSWSKSKEVAMYFAQDAIEDNMSTIVIALPATQLKMVVDVDAIYTDGGEQEVIVLNEPLMIGPHNVVLAHQYDGDL